MTSLPDFIDRVLLRDGMLGKLLPKDILDRDLWRRVNQADDAAIAGAAIGDPGAFCLVRGGLLYALDDLDGAHKFFQDEASDLASYWHGMMHRREGDFDNARYWFRRAGTVPFFDALHGRAAQFSADIAKQLSWDPYLFTGLCEQARFGAEDEGGELVRLQRAEFEAIFDYSWRQARVG
ncbi:MAG: hypothetical protein ABMA13_10065 [Chthoniobacteraceae bacterium]